MGIIDIVLGLLLLFGLVRGFMKGFFVEVASLLALVLGVYGAIHFSDYAVSFLKDTFSWDEKSINILAFAVTFIIIVIVIALAGKALTKIANFAALGVVNKLLGALFGIFKLGLILSILLLIFDKLNRNIALIEDSKIENSIIYHPIKSFAPTVFPSILTFQNKDKEINSDKAKKSI